MGSKQRHLSSLLAGLAVLALAGCDSAPEQAEAPAPLQVSVMTLVPHELAISEATVKAHITAILRKLGVGSRTQAVLVAAKLEVDQPVADSARA